MIQIYTDGAFRVSKNLGGWAFVITHKDLTITESGCIMETTNNQMEIVSLLNALKMLNTAFTDKSIPVEIYSDSQYVINTAGIWIKNWLKTGFKNKKNVEFWLKYLELSQGWDISFIWVKGHAGHYYNELCDEMAATAIENSKPEKYTL